MRINKTTTVGAVAACAVIGATSPVWADSGSNSTTELSPAQQAAVINTLRAEIAKLKAETKADESALHAASKAARSQERALAKARANAAQLKAHPVTRSVTVPATAASTSSRDDANENDNFGGSHPCDHERGHHGDFRGHEGRYGERGDYGRGGHDDPGESWDH